jgi:hypothetical protein
VGVTLRISQQTLLLLNLSNRLQHLVPLPSNKEMYQSSLRRSSHMLSIVDPL